MKKELLFIYGIISIKPVQDAIGPNLFALQGSTIVSIEPVPYGTAKYANIFINNYLYSLGYIMYGVERAG